MFVPKCMRSCLVILLSLIILTKARAQDDPLQDNTKAAQARVEKWDQEDKKFEKKEYWEIPVVVALFLVGGAYYEGGRTAGYAAGGVAACGLTIWFWPSGHRASPDKPSN